MNVAVAEIHQAYQRDAIDAAEVIIIIIIILFAQ